MKYILYFSIALLMVPYSASARKFAEALLQKKTEAEVRVLLEKAKGAKKKDPEMINQLTKYIADHFSSAQTVTLKVAAGNKVIEVPKDFDPDKFDKWVKVGQSSWLYIDKDDNILDATGKKYGQLESGINLEEATRRLKSAADTASAKGGRRKAKVEEMPPLKGSPPPGASVEDPKKQEEEKSKVKEEVKGVPSPSPGAGPPPPPGAGPPPPPPPGAGPPPPPPGAGPKAPIAGSSQPSEGSASLLSAIKGGGFKLKSAAQKTEKKAALTAEELARLSGDQKKLSDKEFKNVLLNLTRIFPAGEVTQNSYKKHIKEQLRTLRSNEKFYKHADLDALQPDLPDKGKLDELMNSAKYPLSNLDKFNENTYIAAWKDIFKPCLFDAAVDPEFDKAVKWLVYYLMGSSRTQEKPNALQQSDSDDIVADIFTTKESVQAWIDSLLRLMVNKDFANSKGLFVSWEKTKKEGSEKKEAGERPDLSGIGESKPILQWLSDPILKKTNIKVNISNDIVKDLLFDGDEIRDEIQKSPVFLEVVEKYIADSMKEDAEESGKKKDDAPKSVGEVVARAMQKVDDFSMLYSSLNKIQDENVKAAVDLIYKKPYEKQEIMKRFSSAGIGEAERTKIDGFFDAEVKTLAFLKKFHELAEKYKKEMAEKDGDKDFKIDFELYKATREIIDVPYLEQLKKDEKDLKYEIDALNTAVKQQKGSGIAIEKLKEEAKQKENTLKDKIAERIKAERLKDAFVNINRYPLFLHSKVLGFLGSLGSANAKIPDGNDFSKMIEPYGILIGVLQQFVKDKNYIKLVDRVHALNKGAIDAETLKTIFKEDKFADFVRANILLTVNTQHVYLNRVSGIKFAIEKYDFDKFKEGVDVFANRAGIQEFVVDTDIYGIDGKDGNKSKDHGIDNKTYNGLMENIKPLIVNEALKSSVHAIKALNDGNYATLKGFEIGKGVSRREKTPRVAALSKLQGKLGLVLDKVEDKLIKNVNIKEFENSYDLFLSEKYLIELGVNQSQSAKLKEALKEFFEEIRDRISNIQGSQLSKF